MNFVHHMERCPNNAPLKTWLEKLNAEGPFHYVIVCGSRNDALQLVDYAKGRKRLADGSWVVVDAGAVVTNAQSAEESAHGHDAAVDIQPVREFFPSGGVKSVYLCDPKREDPEVYAEGLRRYRAMIDSAIAAGLESGEHYPFADVDHVCDKKWRDLPLAA